MGTNSGVLSANISNTQAISLSDVERLRKNYEEVASDWSFFSANTHNWSDPESRHYLMKKRIAYQDAKLAYWCAWRKELGWH